jgi:hypothetical protein
LPASTAGSSVMREWSVVIMGSFERARYYQKPLPDATSKRSIGKRLGRSKRTMVPI